MLTQETANKYFEYKDGDLVWKLSRYKSRIGKSAGTDHVGYKRVQFANKKAYLVHRIIFLIHHGYMPTIVDHIDGDTTNNHIENLRDATYLQNALNVKTRKDSRSKVQNVGWHKYLKKWMVHLTIYGKRKTIGYFDDIELAELVAQEARNKYYGNYGRGIRCSN